MKVFIVILLLLSFALCQKAYDCSSGCLSCQWLGCAACYDSILKQVPSTQYQSFGLAQQTQRWQCTPKQSGDMCLIYGLQSIKIDVFVVKCLECMPGYALDANTNQCVLGTIKDCQVANKQNGSQTCSVCKNGFPSPNLSMCQNIQNPPIGSGFNCISGGRNTDYTDWKASVCLSCKEGFFADYRGFCLNTPQNLVGCMQTDAYMNCTTCDYLRGYFNRVKNSPDCFKSS